MTTLLQAGFGLADTARDVAQRSGLPLKEVLEKTGLGSADQTLTPSALSRTLPFPEAFERRSVASGAEVQGVKGRAVFSLDVGRQSTGSAGMLRHDLSQSDAVRPADLIETKPEVWAAKLTEVQNNPDALGKMITALRADIDRDGRTRAQAVLGKLEGVPKDSDSPHEQALGASIRAKSKLLADAVRASTPKALHPFVDAERGHGRRPLPLVKDDEGVQFDGFEKYTAELGEGDHAELYTFFVPTEQRDEDLQKADVFRSGDWVLPGFHSARRGDALHIEEVYRKGLPRGSAPSVVADHLSRLFEDGPQQVVFNEVVNDDTHDKMFSEVRAGRTETEVFPETTLGRMTKKALAMAGLKTGDVKHELWGRMGKLRLLIDVE